MASLVAVPERLRSLRARPRGADRGFALVAYGAGVLVLGIMGLVGVFLLIQGLPALQSRGTAFFGTQAWDPNSGNFGVLAVLLGTIFIAMTAIVFAVPFAAATALYISEYAPRALKQTLITIVDLMAAIPSIVYGLWGLYLFQPWVLPIARWLATTFGWSRVLRVDGFDPTDPLTTVTLFTSSSFVAGVVVAMMVAPITSSIMREGFTQTPIGEREGALALGSTRWGMIRSVVLPFGRGAMIGGTMLGLGRALGETIAVYLIISPVFVIQPHILQKGANSISSLIALRYSESSPFEISGLMAAGLVLFVLTLFINFGASTVIARSRSGAGSD